jgi:hypothetical protein
MALRQMCEITLTGSAAFGERAAPADAEIRLSGAFARTAHVPTDQDKASESHR